MSNASVRRFISDVVCISQEAGEMCWHCEQSIFNDCAGIKDAMFLFLSGHSWRILCTNDRYL